MSTIFLTLQTIPDQRHSALRHAYEKMSVPENYRNPSAIDKYKRNHLADQHARTAFDGISGQLCSVAWCIGGGTIESLTRGLDCDVDDEKALLRAFFDAVHKLMLSESGAHSRLEWVGHNILDFGLRFMHQRALILGTQPLFQIPLTARHNRGKVFDTMREWSGAHGHVRQADIQKALGIVVDGASHVDRGLEVRQLWSEHRYHDIAAQNQAACHLIQLIYRRLRWGS